MASYYRTQGIVLQKQDVGEADRVFTVFTKDFGKVCLRAVSARKITSKLRGGLELFSRSDIAFVQGKTHKTVTDTVLLESYPNLRADIMGMRVAYRLAEITNELLKGEEKDERIWNLLQETFLFLNRSSMRSKERNVTAYYFLWNLLDFSGYAPPWHNLVRRLLKRNGAVLQHLPKQGIHYDLLEEISKEYLSKALES